MDIGEIAKVGEKCIQKEPVYCTSKCPVHVDVRLMMEKVRAGNFSGAFRIYRKKVLFPNIVSRLCDQPCRQACLRKELDDPLSIRLIERACVEFSTTKDLGQYAVSGKEESVCVIGGGLSGLSCALNLARKGYQLQVYEQSDRLGGRLWKIGDELPAEVITEDIDQAIKREELKISFNSRIDHLQGLSGDAFFIATGAAGNTCGLPLDEDGRPIFNPLSLESAQPGVFVGGSLLLGDAPYSPINAIAQGFQAARSIERYLQKVSLTDNREEEASSTTGLRTRIPAREQKPALKPADSQAGYSKKEAIEEAGRCFLCECMICAQSCRLLAHYRESPDKYITDVIQSLAAVEGFAAKTACRFINSCNVCGLCKEVCPTSLDMGEVCLSGRRILHQTGKMPAVFHDFWLRDMLNSYSEKAFLAKKQPGRTENAFVFFPGCQLGASKPAYVEKVYDYLCRHLTQGVGLILGCCGAPAEWAGNEELRNEMLGLIRENWQEMGRPTIILACPTCRKMFTEYLPEIETRTLWQMVNEYGLPEGAQNGQGKTLTVYDPCSSRYDPEAQEDIRGILKKANYQITEMPYHGKYAQCCSYGGLIYPANPTISEEIIQDRIKASPYDYLTYCVNCRDTFASRGKTAWHILDLLFGLSDEYPQGRKAPGLSQKRDNRLALKEKMLQDVWGETLSLPQEDYERIQLKLAAGLQEKMDRELILLEDVKKVIHYAQTTGNRLLDKNTGCYISYLQEGIITYWVTYLLRDDCYEVVNVYCHRVHIGEDDRG